VQVVQVTDLDRELAAGGGRRGMVPPHGGRARQERADDGARVGGQLSRSALGDDGPAVRPGGRAELDDPVRGGDQLPLVLDDDNGIAVRGQGRDRLAQPHHIARVQPHGRLVEHVEHARRARAHRGGQLDALPLPRRQGRAGPVQLQVTEPDVQQRREPAVQLAGQAGGEGASSSGSAPGRLAANDLSSSSLSALISAIFRPPSRDRRASGRSLVPWHTEQVRVIRKRRTWRGFARCRWPAPARRQRWRSRSSR